MPINTVVLMLLFQSQGIPAANCIVQLEVMSEGFIKNALAGKARKRHREKSRVDRELAKKKDKKRKREVSNKTAKAAANRKWQSTFHQRHFVRTAHMFLSLVH